MTSLNRYFFRLVCYRVVHYNHDHITRLVLQPKNKREYLCLGNDNLHLLTNHKSNQLRVDLKDTSGNKQYAYYHNFEVDSVVNLYNIYVVGYQGNAGE